ncbi:guanine nucleotide exchange factor dbs isoform x1 [Limosa lapponica baueri]|uniref:Guanine nucleotide exchange factor dbs isoform x1 n=1 Tax=Limosa lapponica baueri TaxID=1758121 RepID=A0A2I0TRW2_LIMLA|nr:guanine nucleotide exchange factor dbs isoform x1 [Limosa lapponica baueri]
MSDYWYWRLIPCKETGSCNCFATANQSNEEKEEDTNHQVVVSDIMQLVREKQEVPESTAASSIQFKKLEQKSSISVKMDYQLKMSYGEVMLHFSDILHAG